MYAVLHEKFGAEDFKEHFRGDLFLDIEKKFFGPDERRMLIKGMFSAETWLNIYRAYQKGTSGNMKGDGTLLGGVYLIGPKNSGILYEHREMVFGDKFNEQELLEALKKIT